MQQKSPREKQHPVLAAISLGILLCILLPFMGLGAGIAVRLFLLTSGL